MSGDYSEIGAVLKLARQELHFTVKEVSNYLHIRPHYLQALEDGELEKLPSLVYAKGYLHSYADFLHLDGDEIIRRFEQVKNKPQERGFFFPQVFSAEKRPTSQLIWGGAGAAILLYLFWVLLFKPASVPEFVIEPPPEVHKEEVKPEPAPEATPSTDTNNPSGNKDNATTSSP